MENDVSITQKVAGNSGVLVLEGILKNILSLVSVFIVARFLGAYDFGVINYAFAYLYFFEMIPRFGFDAVVGRALARADTNKSLLLGNAILVRLIFAVVGIALALAGLIIMRKPAPVVLIVSLASFSIFFTLQISYETVLRTYLEMRWAVLINLTKQIIYLLMVLIGAIAGWPLWYFVIATILSGALSLIAYRIAARRYVQAEFKWDVGIIKELISESWPIAVSAILSAVLLRFGIILLESYKGFDAVGQYSAAGKLSEMLYLIPSAWVSSIYPLLSKYYGGRMWAFKKTAFHSLKFMITLGSLLSLAIGFFGSEIIHLIYGNKYQAAGGVLKIMAFAGFFSFMNYVMAVLSFAARHQKKEMIARIVCAAVSVSANFILIPEFSYYGCAGVWIAVEGLYFILCLSYLKRYLLRGKWLPVIGRIAAANAVMFLSFKLFYRVPFIPLATAGLVAGFLSLFLLKVFDSEEIEIMRKMFQRGLGVLSKKGNITQLNA